jgi:hypothetical protein
VPGLTGLVGLEGRRGAWWYCAKDRVGRMVRAVTSAMVGSANARLNMGPPGV